MTRPMNGVSLCAQEWVVENGDSGVLTRNRKKKFEVEISDVPPDVQS